VTPATLDLEFDGSEDEGPRAGAKKFLGKFKEHVKRLPIEIDMNDVTWNFRSFREWEEERNDVEMVDIDEGDNLDRVARFVARTVDRLSKDLHKG